MTSRISFALLLVAALFVCSCSSTRTSTALRASVSSLQQYADSFKGISVDEARSRLAEAKIVEDEWKEGGFGGKQLVASYPAYDLRVLFFEDKAIIVSVEISSK
jgi:hypothetical protein